MVMICDYSQRFSEDTSAINKLIGKPFILSERIKMGGIGSPKFTISKASQNLEDRFSTFDSIRNGSIELRPNGIIIHFKNNLVHYIWAIPYYKLTLYSNEFESFHADGEFISFSKAGLLQKHLTFLGRLQNYRLDYLQAHFSAGPNPI